MFWSFLKNLLWGPSLQTWCVALAETLVTVSSISQHHASAKYSASTLSPCLTVTLWARGFDHLCDTDKGTEVEGFAHLTPEPCPYTCMLQPESRGSTKSEASDWMNCNQRMETQTEKQSRRRKQSSRSVQKFTRGILELFLIFSSHWQGGKKITCVFWWKKSALHASYASHASSNAGLGPARWLQIKYSSIRQSWSFHVASKKEHLF